MFQTILRFLLFFVATTFLLIACGGGSGGSASTDPDPVTDPDPDPDTDVDFVNGSPVTGCDEPLTALSGPYLEFVAAPNLDIVLSESGCTVTIETNGRPDHTSAYWDPNGGSGLWVEAEDPDVFGNPDRDNKSGASSPGFIEDYVLEFNLMVSVSPQFATNPESTHLGELGLSVSGTPIFNEQEGPVDLGGGVIRGLDRNGAHTGPSMYHYHLEPEAVSEDDDALVGIIADGFFIYGRKCYSTGDYPVDLDSANGHTSITQHTGTEDSDAIYHYHITNEPYLDDDSNYLLFGGGTFSGIESDFF